MQLKKALSLRAFFCDEAVQKGEHKLHKSHKLTQKYFSKNYLADN